MTFCAAAFAFFGSSLWRRLMAIEGIEKTRYLEPRV
jgi:hypothetical protein